jgi:CheY-like chemotaxis protein
MHVRLVVADDDDSIRRLIGAALDGYSVFEVARGDDALALARLERPDLILLDVEMPGLDGLAVAEALVGDAATAAIPVVLCSGAGPDAAVAAHRLPNVFGFLAKPFSLRALQTLVEEALEDGRDVPVEMADAPAAAAVAGAPAAPPVETVLWCAGAASTEPAPAPAPVMAGVPGSTRRPTPTGHPHLPGTRYGRPRAPGAPPARRPSGLGRATG